LRVSVVDDDKNQKEDPSRIICHDENVAAYSGMLTNATNMLHHLFGIEQEWPQVVLLNSGCGDITYENKNFSSALCMETLRFLIDAIPVAWNGTLYTIDQSSFSGKTPVLKKSGELQYVQNLGIFSTYIHDTRVRMLNIIGLSAAMRRYSQSSGGCLYGSQHYHRECKMGDIRVCSNVTDVVAQLLLGRAIAPTGRDRWVRPIKTGSRSRLEICTDCPRTMLPFHIKPKPNLTCEYGPMTKAGVAGNTWKPPSCPSECLRTDPVGQQVTQRGSVDVRDCNVLQ
jgi:hypothetical protein